MFVDGCFWHGCPTCRTGIDQSTQFWKTKIATNRERDQKVTRLLEAQEWRVLRVFEHEIRTKAGLEATTDTMVSLLRPEASGEEA